MKSNTNFLLKLLNNEFRKLLQKVDHFPPLISNERLLEAGILLSPKMVIYSTTKRDVHFRAWAFIRYFTVSNLHNYEY